MLTSFNLTRLFTASILSCCRILYHLTTIFLYSRFFHFFLFLGTLYVSAADAALIEINGSAYATDGAPLPKWIKNPREKVIVVEPREHVFGAYAANGRLIRWGIATAGSSICPESHSSCRTKVGSFRIFSLGDSNCISKKYDDAPMPYCMYFSGGEALHGSTEIEFNNISHGCIRVHIDDAQWLRYHFVEGPNSHNHYQGTKIIVRPY
jgi:lipoprotein-anchoring transpeptidase ErfK/SrfK